MQATANRVEIRNSRDQKSPSLLVADWVASERPDRAATAAVDNQAEPGAGITEVEAGEVVLEATVAQGKVRVRVARVVLAAPA